jgi:hypothetical protein
MPYVRVIFDSTQPRKCGKAAGPGNKLEKSGNAIVKSEEHHEFYNFRF